MTVKLELLDELKWLKRVTEDDTTNVYGRTIDRIEALEGALERLIETCEDRRVEEFDPSSRVTVLETRTKDILAFHEALDEAAAALKGQSNG